MDIKKDAETGTYQVSEAEQIDDTYDLHGLMFEFSRHNEGEVFYQMVRKTKEEIMLQCPIPEPVVVEVEKVVEVEVPAEPEPVFVPEPYVPPPVDLGHRKMNFSMRCSGLVHTCDECSFHEEHDLVTGEMRCGTYEFCFTWDGMPHCSDCTPFGEGCSYCDYGGCLKCKPGYWKMSGICVA